MHNWDREQQDNKFRQKLNNVKSTLPKINHPNTTTNITIKNKATVAKLPFTKKLRKQNNLKYILREFGLSQYIRKLFDLGYDDSNVLKLGLLTQKQFEELLLNLKIFPGHQVKFSNLYEYLKQKNASTQRRKPNTSSGSKVYGGSSRRLQKIKTKAISANQRNIKQNSNTIVKSFINGNFGYNYYLNNNQAQLDKEESDDGNRTIRNENVDDMSEEIDEMLKYYMDQLNEKLDDSYDSVQDSSLSQVVITNQNEKKSKSEITKDKVNPPIGKKSIPIRLPSINTNETNIVKDSTKTEDKKNTSLKDNIPIVQVPEQILDKNIIEQKEEPIIEVKPEEIKADDDLYFEPHEPNLNEHQEEIQTEPNIPKEDISTQKENENPPQVSSSLLKAQTTQYKIIQQTNEQEVYNNLRLTKSSEGDYLRQNLYQFDIEYMCRCLGLAIMKHIESGKDKQHITELLDIKDNFSFFNSLYNSKMDFLFNFFDKDVNQMSNLDRIDYEEHQKQKEHISFVNHFKQKKDEELLKQTEEKDKIKLHSNYGDIEKDIKFIDEFFSVSNKQKKNYLNLSEKTKTILNKELSYINEVDSDIMNSKLNSSGNNTNRSELSKKGYENILKQSIQNMISKEEEDYQDNKFSSVPNEINDESYKQTPLINKISEELPKEVEEKEEFESGEMESNYVIDASTIEKLKTYITKQAEIYDDDYVYSLQRIQTRKYVPPPDPQQIFEFCANVMCLTKMEKEVIIITLIYIERLMFNTGLLLTSRNWRRISFTAMVIASKIWDDDSFENNHFAQVFTHLSIGEINLLERTYLELINYKVYVKCSEYFKYFFIIKSIALKYNYNGMNIVPISVEKMMKIQEYAYQMQKKVKKNYALNNSAQF